MRLQTLTDNHPILFGQYASPYEIPEAWYPLAERIIEAAIPYAGKVQFAQFKEKFGALRVYWDMVDPNDHNFPEEFNNVVMEAEIESTKICQRCGGKATRATRKGWIIYLCEEHFQQ